MPAPEDNGYQADSDRDSPQRKRTRTKKVPPEARAEQTISATDLEAALSKMTLGGAAPEKRRKEPTGTSKLGVPPSSPVASSGEENGEVAALTKAMSGQPQAKPLPTFKLPPPVITSTEMAAEFAQLLADTPSAPPTLKRSRAEEKVVSDKGQGQGQKEKEKEKAQRRIVRPKVRMSGGK